MEYLAQITPYWGKGDATLRSPSFHVLFTRCNLRCNFSQSSNKTVWICTLNSPDIFGLSWLNTTRNRSIYLAVLRGSGARGGSSQRCLGAGEEARGGLGCAQPLLRQVHKHFPLLGATCSLLDVYYKSMQFHKAPACNKTLLHVWGLKEINGSSLGMHILLRCLLQMKWSWGKTLTSCRVIKGILSFLSDTNRKKPLTKSIKFLFPNEFALTIC